VLAAPLPSIWTLCYLEASRYNWMFQYYLRAAGLALSWVGTGRLIFSLNYSDADFSEVADRILSAARNMRQDGWWWSEPQLTNQSIRRRVFKEMVQARWASAASPATSPMGSISSPRIK
jgi:glutamate-1-semialdehyde 2,1-aminomutase